MRKKSLQKQAGFDRFTPGIKMRMKVCAGGLAGCMILVPNLKSVIGRRKQNHIFLRYTFLRPGCRCVRLVQIWTVPWPDIANCLPIPKENVEIRVALEHAHDCGKRPFSPRLHITTTSRRRMRYQ